MGDIMKAPQISSLDILNFDPSVGGTIRVTAEDNVGVCRLELYIQDEVSGSIVAETRYKARPLRSTSGVPREGETRYTSGTLPTKYTYTGQYSNVSDFGWMYYNARWYDPALGRMAQADTVVPAGVQGYDRYAYTNNNPIAYTDPSGHVIQGRCNYRWNYNCEMSSTKSLQSGLPDYGQYFGCGVDTECTDWAIHTLGISSWEYQILDELYGKGGPEAAHGVNYILANDIHISVGRPFRSVMPDPDGAFNPYGGFVFEGDWQSLGSVTGWFNPGSKSIVLNPYAGYQVNQMPDPWGLSIIVHEAKHLEQGKPLTKYKELEAWQLGFRVARKLGYPINPYSVTQSILNLPLNADQATIDQFSDYVWQYDKTYWFPFSRLLDR